MHAVIFIQIISGNKVGLNKVGLNKVGLNKVGLNKVGLNKVGLNYETFRNSKILLHCTSTG